MYNISEPPPPLPFPSPVCIARGPHDKDCAREQFQLEFQYGRTADAANSRWLVMVGLNIILVKQLT